MKSGRDKRLQAAALRVQAAAAALLASEEAAARYLITANFALGAATPLEMLKRPGGEAAVMNELQTHDESGRLNSEPPRRPGYRPVLPRSSTASIESSLARLTTEDRTGWQHDSPVSSI